jgi:ABC-2 type transport system permease protein
VRLFAEIARAGFRRYATYRAATAAGVFTNTVFGFIQAYVLLAVYAVRTDVGGFDATDAMTYVFVAQGLLAPVDAFAATIEEISDRIRTGDIVTDLYRPVGFLPYWLALDVGRAVFQIVARGIPPFLGGALVFDLRLPSGPGAWAAFAVAAGLAVVISFALRMITALSGFWVLDARGQANVLVILLLFFSGFLVPVNFFPGWLETLSRLLPFAAIVQSPIEIWLGKADVAATLGVQLLWAVAMLAAARAVVAAATRQVVVHGG